MQATHWVVGLQGNSYYVEGQMATIKTNPYPSQEYNSKNNITSPAIRKISTILKNLKYIGVVVPFNSKTKLGHMSTEWLVHWRYWSNTCTSTDGDGSYKDLGVFHFSKIFRDLVITGMPEHMFQSERQIIAACTFNHDEGNVSPGRHLQVLEEYTPHLGILSRPVLLCDTKFS